MPEVEPPKYSGENLHLYSNVLAKKEIKMFRMSRFQEPTAEEA